MKKIVINADYGGFSVSHEAMLRYAEIKGITLYVETKEHRWYTTYWTVPPEDRPDMETDWYSLTTEERVARNEAYRNSTLSIHEFKRDDPVLVQVVEELGEKANGEFASLRIVEIPDDIDWVIEEYDGREWVSESHRTWY